eukprot:1748403-Amphidinium_carterae.1
MIQRSYIKYHPTGGYKTATPEIKRVYDGFEVYNYNEERNPRKPLLTNIKDDDYKHMGQSQLLSISYQYAPNFFNTMKIHQLDNLRKQGWKEEQVRQHEHVLQNTKLLELYIILPEKAIDMWLRLGSLPASYMEDSTEIDIPTTTFTQRCNTLSTTTSTCASTTSQTTTKNQQDNL